MDSATAGTSRSRPLSKVLDFLGTHHIWCVLLYLVALEIVVFAAISPRVGFYLDDWGMLEDLFFGPAQFVPKLMNYFLHEPKVIIRPVESLHFGTLFWIFGTKPLGYHLFNGLMEIASALLLYLCLFFCSNQRTYSGLVAALFLLCPLHDSTHYWILASSATLSMLLYLGSLLSTIQAERKKQPWLHLLSLFLFSISLFSYECFMPLAAVNVVCGCWMRLRQTSYAGIGFPKSLIRLFLLLSAGFASDILLLWLWLRVAVPKLGTGWLHSVTFSSQTMVDTVVRGTVISLPAEQITFFSDYVCKNCDSSSWGTVTVIVVLTAVALYALSRADSVKPSKSSYLLIGAIAGILMIPLSFTVFGLNPEYTPTLITIVNRINYGASLGTCMLYGALLLMTCQLIARKPQLSRGLVAGGSAALLCCFALSDLAMAKPWELSWVMQRHVASLVNHNSAACSKASSLMLMDSPRYVMWAPVFDGVWDFRPLVRLTLKQGDFKADVVSERLQFEKNQISDISSGFVCGTYPYQGMMAVVAPKSLLVPINSPDEFVACVQKNGFAFGLDSQMPQRWREQMLAASARNSKTY